GRAGPVAVGDFNGDGAPDLAIATDSSDDVTVVLNRNDGLAPGRGGAAKTPHAAAMQAPPAQSDATLGQAVAQTLPPAVPPDAPTARSAPSGGQEAAADAYLVALAREDLDALFPQRRGEIRNELTASRPVGYADEGLAALAAVLVADPTEA